MSSNFEFDEASASGLRPDALKSVRSISSAREIPVFGREAPLGLIKTGAMDISAARRLGVFPTQYGMKVTVKDPFAFDELEPHLPLMARRSLRPFIVDVPISVSPASRLENILSAKCWRSISRRLVAGVGCCEWCGQTYELQPREDWGFSYGVNLKRDGHLIEDVQTFKALWVLCKRCHEASNVDLASAYRTSSPVHLDRLYQIFRIHSAEERLLYVRTVEFLRNYRTLVSGRGRGRDNEYRQWALDLTRLANWCHRSGIELVLKRTLADLGSCTFQGKIGKGSSKVTLLGVASTPSAAGFGLCAAS